MGESNDGSDAAAGATDPDEPGTRGLFGRLLNVFSPSADADTDGGSATDTAQAQTAALPGMGNLRRMRVDDVAVPKVEIVAVPVTISKDDLVEVFRDSGFSRLPVFKGTLDSPLGLIHLKDLALQHGFGAGNGRFSLRKLLRPLLYVPPSMSIGVLLQKMQSQRIHMAMVIDEYGGVDGLLTIEDLIEQVIGEIEDEHDDADDSTWTLERPGVYLAQARTPLEAFEAEIGQSLSEDDEDEEIDTLGGLLFVLAGRVPVRGEVIRHPGGVEFEVIEADPRRIKRLRVRLPDAERSDAAEAGA